VLLSELHVVGSPFIAGGLDLTLYRIPVDGWEYLFLSSGDYVRYFDVSAVPHEATAIVEGQVTKTLGQSWKLGLTAEYVYFDQVLDSSVFPEVFTSVPVQGNGFTIRPSLRKDLGQGYRLELEVPATRQIFDQFIDNYWEAGPKLTFDKEYGRKSDLAISYQFTDRLHDTREARDTAGDLLAGSRLEFYMHELAVAWRQHWGYALHWRTQTKIALQRNWDNGGGYYNYWRPLVSEQLRYQRPSWEVRAEARVSYYNYDHELIGLPGSPTREVTYLRFNLRAERTLFKSLKGFVQYEHEQALSNQLLDRYTANTVSAGVDWEF
jgi:hypothetical protein